MMRADRYCQYSSDNFPSMARMFTRAQSTQSQVTLLIAFGAGRARSRSTANDHPAGIPSSGASATLPQNEQVRVIRSA
jgi:hypothetical protein